MVLAEALSYKISRPIMREGKLKKEREREKKRNTQREIKFEDGL